MPLADSGTHIEVSAERMVARRLGGNCRMPLAAYCITEADGRLRLRARVGAEDGSALCQTDLFSGAASVSAAEAVGVQAAQALLDQGAGRWLGSS